MRHAFFDLDGTLTDSRLGITRCIQHALQSLGRDAPDEAELLNCIGPPLDSIFGRLLESSSAQLIESAITAYRSRYDTIGILETILWPGMSDALHSLSTNGHQLCVVTAKPTVYARRILARFNVDTVFDSVYGPDLTSRGYDKTSLIRTALEDVGCAPTSVVMIGDRADDVLGARNNRVTSIAVTWGYGSAEELKTAAPDYVVSSVSELVSHLRVLKLAAAASMRDS